jgi:hypothetical protein
MLLNMKPLMAALEMPDCGPRNRKVQDHSTQCLFQITTLSADSAVLVSTHLGRLWQGLGFQGSQRVPTPCRAPSCGSGPSAKSTPAPTTSFSMQVSRGLPPPCQTSVRLLPSAPTAISATTSVYAVEQPGIPLENLSANAPGAAKLQCGLKGGRTLQV